MARPHIHTVHHRHFGWDNRLPPQARAKVGDTLTFDIQDASGGQLSEHSSAADVAAFDFSRTNPVNGPVYIEGAQPGDVLCVEVLDFQEGNWGWTALIPGPPGPSPAPSGWRWRNRDSTAWCRRAGWAATWTSAT